MDVLEYEGETEADEAIWALLDLDASHRAQMEDLRPPRPFWISSADRGAVTRWASAMPPAGIEPAHAV